MTMEKELPTGGVEKTEKETIKAKEKRIFDAALIETTNLMEAEARDVANER